MHLASAHMHSRRGIVPIIAPCGMAEVNYKTTAIRDDRIIESQSADATPIAECAALPLVTLGRRLMDRPLVLSGFLVSIHWTPGVWPAQSLCRSSDAGVR
jgi:hypothetical protein